MLLCFYFTNLQPTACCLGGQGVHDLKNAFGLHRASSAFRSMLKKGDSLG